MHEHLLQLMSVRIVERGEIYLVFLIQDPQTGSGSKTLCCLCCESGPISANFRIDRRGYVPGECIVLDGEVDNKSNRSMSHTKVELRMVSDVFTFCHLL